MVRKRRGMLRNAAFVRVSRANYRNFHNITGSITDVDLRGPPVYR
jgi:hypothetical protein